MESWGTQASWVWYRPDAYHESPRGERTSGDAQRRFESAHLRQIGHRHPAFGALPACSSKENREGRCRMHNVSQDVSLGPAVASRGLVTSGGTAVGAIKRHVQCAVDRRVGGVARRHVPGYVSIGARTACCLRHSICWLRDDTRAPMTKRASSRRRSGECALLLRPLNLRSHRMAKAGFPTGSAELWGLRSATSLACARNQSRCTTSTLPLQAR